MLIIIIIYQTHVFFLSIATKSSVLPGMDAYERGRLMRQELMDTLEELSAELPPNTLDELIDELGGPDNVAEVRWSSSNSNVLFFCEAQTLHFYVFMVK